MLGTSWGEHRRAFGQDVSLLMGGCKGSFIVHDVLEFGLNLIGLETLCHGSSGDWKSSGLLGENAERMDATSSARCGRSSAFEQSFSHLPLHFRLRECFSIVRHP